MFPPYKLISLDWRQYTNILNSYYLKGYKVVCNKDEQHLLKKLFPILLSYYLTILLTFLCCRRNAAMGSPG